MILDLFRKEVEFENIKGYEDLKDIARRALDAEDDEIMSVCKDLGLNFEKLSYEKSVFGLNL